MNVNPMSPYVETTADSLASTRRFITDVLGCGGGLASPVVAPRFALACDLPLMAGLADLAKEFGLRVHSHLSENKSEVKESPVTYPLHNWTEN